MTEEVKSEEVKETAKDGKEDATKKLDDDIRWREKYKHTKGELESERLKTAAEKEAILNKVTETEKAKSMLETTLVETELTYAANAAGIKDAEFLKLLDRSEIKLVDGKVQGVEKAITDLKTRKPDWFTTEKKTSTSSGAAVNREAASSTRTVDAWSLEKHQFAAEKAKLTKGRYR